MTITSPETPEGASGMHPTQPSSPPAPSSPAGPPDATASSLAAKGHSTARREAWKVSRSGVWLVAQLELRQRVRSTKWKAALVTVAALIGGVTLLMWAALHSFDGENSPDTGNVIFGLVVFFVLFIGLVISPTLSATTINGDVRDGTMAPLQATGLSAVDIVLGKLLASWAASLAFVVVAIPFIAFAYLDGSMPVWAMLVVVLVLAVELLVVCALGIGWSALTARTPSSAVLTFTTVAVLSVVLPIVFGLLSAVVQQEVRVTERNEIYYDASSAPKDAIEDPYGNFIVCEESTYVTNIPRTDKLWWLLAVNPYVIVADSAPSPTVDSYYNESGLLSGLKQAVREARLGPSMVNDYCGTDTGGTTAEEQERRDSIAALPPVWPWGLAFQALMGLGAVALAVRRVSVPYGELPTGSRVA